MRAALGKTELRRIYGRLASRYDLQHAVITARADQRGRKLLVQQAVKEGDAVLDCGAGTGTTGILAAKATGPGGSVTLFDLSSDMLDVARDKVAREGLQDRVAYEVGDMVALPFEDGRFDVVLSSYSLCPVYDPQRGAMEMYRVTRPGGKIGIAHSTEPRNGLLRWLADRVEDIAWKFPGLSMGCRAVDVLATLQAAGGRIEFIKHIGVPLWPFLVLVVARPGHCTSIPDDG